MRTRYSLTTTRINGKIEHSYSGSIGMLGGLDSSPIMRNINDPFFISKREELTQILEQHEEEFDKDLNLIKLKTTYTEHVNNKSRLRNWLSKTWEDIKVYTGPW